jgi:hypothetical protein
MICRPGEFGHVGPSTAGEAGGGTVYRKEKAGVSDTRQGLFSGFLGVFAPWVPRARNPLKTRHCSRFSRPREWLSVK